MLDYIGYRHRDLSGDRNTGGPQPNGPDPGRSARPAGRPMRHASETPLHRRTPAMIRPCAGDAPALTSGCAAPAPTTMGWQ
jgi:hypothetical protein